MAKNNGFKSPLTKEHEGKWVALSGDRSKVIAASENLSTLMGRVKDQDAIYERVLSSNKLYAF